MKYTTNNNNNTNNTNNTTTNNNNNLKEIENMINNNNNITDNNLIATENNNITVDNLINLMSSAIEDYYFNTDNGEPLKGITYRGLKTLAQITLHKKQSLRELFRKHPNWNESTQRITIKQEFMQNINYNTYSNIFELLYLNNIIEYSTASELANIIVKIAKQQELKQIEIELLNRHSNCNNYKKGKKTSRVLNCLCKGIGIADDAAGSEYQKKFMYCAELLKPVKTENVYISINPGDILTISNPKEAIKGSGLTSCHSLNNSEYYYKAGNTGYINDPTTFTVFTAASDSPEDIHANKTRRQLFAYENGILLQNKAYFNTDTREMIDKTFSEIVKNILTLCDPQTCKSWQEPIKTDFQHLARPDQCYRGYSDFLHYNNGTYYHIAEGTNTDDRQIITGGPCICLCCGDITDNDIYCNYCLQTDDNCNIGLRCTECGEIVDPNYCFYDDEGNVLCEYCFYENYNYCSNCEEVHRQEDLTYIGESGEELCPDCIEELCFKCDICHDWHYKDGKTRIIVNHDIDEIEDVKINDIDDINAPELINICDPCYLKYSREIYQARQEGRIEYILKCQYCKNEHMENQIYTFHSETSHYIENYICKQCIEENLQDIVKDNILFKPGKYYIENHLTKVIEYEFTINEKGVITDFINNEEQQEELKQA